MTEGNSRNLSRTARACSYSNGSRYSTVPVEKSYPRPPLYKMAGGSAPSRRAYGSADDHILPVARHTRTPCCCAARTAASVRGVISRLDVTSVPSRSVTSRRYVIEWRLRRKNGTGGHPRISDPGSQRSYRRLRQRQRNAQVCLHRSIAGLHELGRLVAIVCGHGDRALTQAGVDELAIVREVSPLLFKGHLETVDGLDLGAGPRGEPRALELLGDNGFVLAVDLDPLIGKQPARVRHAGQRGDHAGCKAQHDHKPVCLRVNALASPRLQFLDLAEQKPAHVTQVHRSLVQVAPGHRRIPRPRRLFQLPAIVLQLGQQRGDAAFLDQPVRKPVHVSEPSVEPELVESAGAPRGRADLRGTEQGGRHGLFREHVHTRR